MHRAVGSSMSIVTKWRYKRREKTHWVGKTKGSWSDVQTEFEELSEEQRARNRAALLAMKAELRG